MASCVSMDKVVSLAMKDRGNIESHLLALSAEERELRFFSPVSDTTIRDFAQRFKFGSDVAFGIFESVRGKVSLVALATLSVSIPETHRQEGGLEAELGLSVHKNFQKKGFGSQLVTHIQDYASKNNISRVHVFWLRTNSAMEKLMKKHGEHFSGDGLVAQGVLKLN